MTVSLVAKTYCMLSVETQRVKSALRKKGQMDRWLLALGKEGLLGSASSQSRPLLRGRQRQSSSVSRMLRRRRRLAGAKSRPSCVRAIFHASVVQQPAMLICFRLPTKIELGILGQSARGPLRWRQNQGTPDSSLSILRSSSKGGDRSARVTRCVAGDWQTRTSMSRDSQCFHPLALSSHHYDKPIFTQRTLSVRSEVLAHPCHFGSRRLGMLGRRYAVIVPEGNHSRSFIHVIMANVHWRRGHVHDLSIH